MKQDVDDSRKNNTVEPSSLLQQPPATVDHTRQVSCPSDRTLRAHDRIANVKRTNWSWVSWNRSTGGRWALG